MPPTQLINNLSAKALQIEYFDKIIFQIIADMEAVSWILLEQPKPPLNKSNGRGTALDLQPIIRKGSLRKESSTTSILSSRKSSKKDSRTVIFTDTIMPCHEYFLALNEERNLRMIDLRRRIDSIGPLLIKLESLVLGTSSGESHKMDLYYRHWEETLFTGLVRLVKNNLNAFIKALDDTEPLFQVDAQLMMADVILRPDPKEVYHIIYESVNDFIQRISGLKRWKPGTSVAFDDYHKGHKNRRSVCENLPNFIDDIIGDASVAEQLHKIQTRVDKLVQEAKLYLTR